MIKRVVSFLQGRTSETELYINDQMSKAANETRYEDAAMYRDQLNAIKKFKDRQRKVAADFDDRDVIALSRKENMCVSVIVRIRNGRIHSREKISMDISDETDSDIIALVITQFYLNSDFIPKVLNVSDIPTNKAQLKYWLKEKRNGKEKLKHQILPTNFPYEKMFQNITGYLDFDVQLRKGLASLLQTYLHRSP